MVPVEDSGFQSNRKTILFKKTETSHLHEKTIFKVSDIMLHFYFCDMMTQKLLLKKLLLLFCILIPVLTFGKVKEVRFHSKEIILDGKKFGEVGAYEVLKGKISFFCNPVQY